MPPEEFPASIREFISRHVRSVEQLEVLLFFQKYPGAIFSAQQVYDAILSSPQSVQRWLDELSQGGLLEKVPEPAVGYRCSQDAAVAAQVASLEAFYRSAPVRVIEAIYRREASAAQSFADAFKIKNTSNPSS